MKAAVWYGSQEIRIEDVPLPEIGNKEVLIRVKSVGICGSDLHAYEGISKRRVPPLILGHEFSGEIQEIGKNVEELVKGDRVVVNPVFRCGNCEPCSLGCENVCRDLTLLGLHKDGAFAEYSSVVAKNCQLLPDNLSYAEGVMVEPFSVAVHAVKRAQIQIGDTVVVVGAGIIGLSIVQAAKTAGSGRIIVTDLLDYRLKLAKKLGADITINAIKENPVKSILEATTKKGADVVFEAVGIEQTVRQATKITKTLGKLTILGNLAKSVNFDIMDVVTRELDVRGSYCYTSREFKKAIDFISNRRFDVASMITNVLPLEKVKEGFELLSKKEKDVVKVILQP